MPDWFEATTAGIADSAKAVVNTFAPGKVGFINLVIDIIPWCDSVSFSGRPIISHLGVFACYDPVLPAHSFQWVEEVDLAKLM
jgi:uncharacterized Fe-S center protein